jgi:DNA (cytosine-5)-methyltransferase 1
MAGHEAVLLCENDPFAKAVLEYHFPEVDLASDVRDLTSLPPDVEVVAAGFPCQDLSQAGETRGINGSRSGLVRKVFDLVDASRPAWVVLENVPFMLQLGRGTAMRYIAESFESRGYNWAYRTVDTLAFGLPQRRRRVFMLASHVQHPASILFQDDAGEHEPKDIVGSSRGFYWTEGLRGVGWAVNSVPTLKGGSTIGIPSPPAIWMPDGRIVTPDLRDAERMQGFPADWTLPAEEVGRKGYRWKLVGNAVTVKVAEWIGSILLRSEGEIPDSQRPISMAGAWPASGYSRDGGRWAHECSAWPVALELESVHDFLRHQPKPLSLRATVGFRGRLRRSQLRAASRVDFIHALDSHAERMGSSSQYGFQETLELVQTVSR